MRALSLLLFVMFTSNVLPQTVYKTPSGSKYHSATCRYVKNVSHALTTAQAKELGLTACTICIGTKQQASPNTSTLGLRATEAQGVGEAVQCKGKTKAGKRCSR